MRVASTFCVFCIASLLTPLSAWAFGALAIGNPSDVPHQGFAYGMSYNHPTDQAARDMASHECLTAPGNIPDAHAACTVVQSFQKQCMAVAMDPAAGTPGVGWGIATDLEVAKQQAINSCRATSGQDRQEYCVIDKTSCDTHD